MSLNAMKYIIVFLFMFSTVSFAYTSEDNVFFPNWLNIDLWVEGTADSAENCTNWLGWEGVTLPSGNITGGVGTDCSATGTCSNITYLNYDNMGNFTLTYASYAYSMTSAPMDWNGTSYDQDFDTGNHDNAYIVNSRPTTNIIPCKTASEPCEASLASDTRNMGIVLFDVAGGALYLTMYFFDDEFSNATDAQDWLDGLCGGCGALVDYYKESFWIAGKPDYTLNNTDGLNVTTNFTTPPTFTGVPAPAFELHFPTGEIEVKKDLNLTGTGSLFQVTDGRLLFGFQDSSPADVNEMMWAISSGMSIYGSANYNYPIYPYQASVRLDIDDHTANVVSMIDTRFTMAGGGHASSNKSNVGTLSFFNAQTSREDGDPSGTINTLKVFSDANTFDFNVTNYFSFFTNNHGDVAQTSWGIYNFDRTYLDRNVFIGSNAEAITNSSFTMLDNKSLYVHGTSGFNDNVYMEENLSVRGYITEDNYADISEMYYTKGYIDSVKCEDVIEEHKRLIENPKYPLDCSIKCGGMEYSSLNREECLNCNPNNEQQYIYEYYNTTHEECKSNEKYIKELSSGEVVCIDINNPELIVKCTDAFDSKVLSWVSTNPSMLINAKKGGYPIILSGKAPLKVDCTVPINVGDLLVTSNTDGYAQKFTISALDQSKNIGTVFAKALEACSSGTDIIEAWKI